MTRLDVTALLSAVAGAALLMSSSNAALAGPFSGYEGTWSGGGTISVSNGSKERLRCREHNSVGGAGTSLSQSLTCASDSYKFNVVANVQASGSALSGTWSETTRGANGALSGSVSPSQVSAQVSGAGFSASIGISVRGNRQSVVIRPTGTEITAVSVAMSKGR